MVDGSKCYAAVPENGSTARHVIRWGAVIICDVSNLVERRSRMTFMLFVSASLTPSSPLRQQLNPKNDVKKKSQSMSKLKPGLVGRKGQIVDQQPITFKDKVTSSGYADIAPT